MDVYVTVAIDILIISLGKVLGSSLRQNLEFWDLHEAVAWFLAQLISIWLPILRSIECA